MKRCFVVFAAAMLMAASCFFLLSGPASATLIPGLTSNGSLGAMTSWGSYSDWTQVFDTDNGGYYFLTPPGTWEPQQFPAGQTYSSDVVTETGGPSIRVFNFTTFTLPAGVTLDIMGSMPAAIVATGNIAISGTINVTAGSAAGGAGGYNSTTGYPGSGPGSAGGSGGGHSYAVGAGWGASRGNSFYFPQAGSGGGGGSASKGGKGESGPYIISYPSGYSSSGVVIPNGGGAGGLPRTNYTVLTGGGGAGGGGSYGSGGISSGAVGGAGGAGGGALLIGTSENVTVSSTGQVHADGQAGSGPAGNGGAGGGGGGGELAFQVGGILTNNGTITAKGGAWGPDWAPAGDGWISTHIGMGGGAGSGGIIYIDPSAIINNGLIDVSSGDNTSQIGGFVLTNGVLVTGTGQINGVATPVPSSMLLFGPGLAGLAAIRRRFKK